MVTRIRSSSFKQTRGGGESNCGLKKRWPFVGGVVCWSWTFLGPIAGQRGRLRYLYSGARIVRCRLKSTSPGEKISLSGWRNLCARVCMRVRTADRVYRTSAIRRKKGVASGNCGRASPSSPGSSKNKEYLGMTSPLCPNYGVKKTARMLSQQQTMTCPLDYRKSWESVGRW